MILKTALAALAVGHAAGVAAQCGALVRVTSSSGSSSPRSVTEPPLRVLARLRSVVDFPRRSEFFSMGDSLCSGACSVVCVTSTTLTVLQASAAVAKMSLSEKVGVLSGTGEIESLLNCTGATYSAPSIGFPGFCLQGAFVPTS
jgi:hypothetical protein